MVLHVTDCKSAHAQACAQIVPPSFVLFRYILHTITNCYILLLFLNHYCNNHNFISFEATRCLFSAVSKQALLKTMLA